MGQKIHPTGFRLSVSRNWSSRWYASNRDFAGMLAEDIKVRDYLKTKLKNAAVSRILIERPAKNARITIFSARPGVVIGKKGEDIENLKKELASRLGVPVAVNIEEVRKPEIDAQLIADSITQQLEKRIMFRRAMKRAMQNAMRLGAQGIKIMSASRLNGIEIARTESYRERARRADPRVVQALARYSDGIETKVFVNRARFVTEVVRRASLIVSVYVSDGPSRRYSWISRGGTGGLEHLDVTDEALAEVTATAAALLEAVPVDPGMYDVVVDQSVAGILAHEAFGHGVETDMFLKERARGAAYLGERVGSDLVTIMDDPTVPGGYGTYFVDDEGHASTPTCIIRDGVLQRGLTDLYSATRLGIDRSANGRRESFERKAYARMSNTFFAPGSHAPDELLSSLEDGLYI